LDCCGKRSATPLSLRTRHPRWNQRRQVATFCRRISESGIVVLTLMLSVLLAATGPAGAAEAVTKPPPPRILRLARISDPQNLDPTKVVNQADFCLLPLLYQPLIDLQGGTNFVNHLTTNWTVSPDSRKFTFDLLPSVRFSNGREATAKDYAFALERAVLVDDFYQPYALQIKGAPEFLAARTTERDQLKTNSAAGQGRWIEPTGIAGLSTPSRYRLEVELEKPDTSFKAWFPQNLGMALAQESLPDVQETLTRHVVGTGPYVLKEWIRGVRIRLERNPYYFRPEQQHFEAVEIFIGGDETTHLMMFERDELDLAGLERTGVPEADFSRLRKDSRWGTNWLEGPIFNIAAIILNAEVPPLNDPRVRQAIAHAIRRDHFQQKLNHDRIDPGAGVITPTMPGFNPALIYHNYDTNRARALLREAGFPGGISQPITLWHIDDQVYRRWAQAIAADLKEIGITNVLKGVTVAAFSTARGERGGIPMQINAETALFPDASGFLGMFHGRQIKTSGSANIAFYDNPKLNALLDEAMGCADEARRLELYRQAEQIFVDDAPVIVLGHPKIFSLRQPWLRGPLLDPLWWYRFDRVWFEK